MPLAAHNTPSTNSLEEQQISAVNQLELGKVIDLHTRGADVNHHTPPEKCVYVNCDNKQVPCENHEVQPYSALRMAVFRCSDSALEYSAPHLQNPAAQLQEITELLLENGADALDAYRLIESRHGDGCPNEEWENDAAMATLNLIARQAQGK
jgi:hypothetical protein